MKKQIHYCIVHIYYLKILLYSLMAMLILINNAFSVFNVKREPIYPRFFAVNFDDPHDGIFTATNVYSGNVVRYYIEENSREFNITYNNQTYSYNTSEFLHTIIPRWEQVFHFQEVSNRAEADLIIRQAPVPTVGMGAGADALAYPIGFPDPTTATSYSTALLEFHPDAIEHTLINLNSIDRSYMFFNTDHDFVNMVLTFIFTHELGHVLGYQHSYIYPVGCETTVPLTVQASLMVDLQTFMRIQYHINGDIPVMISQIYPSELDVRMFRYYNDGCGTKMKYSQKAKSSCNLKASCDPTIQSFDMKLFMLIFN